MEQVNGWMSNVGEYARQHRRSVTAIGTAVGATVGFGIATSKIGLFVAGAIGVVFAVSVGAVTGRVIGEVISRQTVEYIPPKE